ncbi:M24 family metallopeptidase [Paenibacillus sacheonensis]|uniref:M24 family metallopeptidase n=1 Tax=Paenibacillus sacheonensis TaxID=742054 RepID=A0A7X4YM68_9BACL|nr:Xaa-Pro peptidase family protein [Paenibacillus sacheonensis]MBM7564358.1 Xaa-Pro aminopeptidase [Paenibacillus sacheonensis]NBC68921.1 M24 family metallopeptidase [Paenibacillus sacheonensis]
MTTTRIAGLREKLQQIGVDAFLVTNAVNRRYISAFTGSSGVLLVSQKDSWLLTDFRYMTQAPEQAVDFAVVQHAPKWIDTVKELAVSAGIKRLAFEQDTVVFSEYTAWKSTLGDAVELVPVSGVIEELRLYKDESELAIMRDACKLADDTFQHMLTFIKPGLREREVALEMEMFMRSRGATSSSFDTIVASGERSALPHGVASERVIGSNEFVKLDFGAYYNGYCSDLTRTVVVGKPTDRHRQIYEIVLEAQLAALAGIKPGMTGKEADALARDIITKHGFGDKFGHGTGHGLGMEIHEAPRLSIGGTTVLEPGMTVTVEPGIYLPGFGGVRIEDDIVITATGNSLLTSSPKTLFILE